MRIEILDCVNQPLCEEVWLMYDRAFEEVNTQTPCRQSYGREDFLGKLQDAEIVKIVIYDDKGAVAGIAMTTNRIEKLDWISVPFFENHFPDAFREGRVFYVPVIAVRLDLQGKLHYFARLVKELAQYAVFDRGGFVVMDCSETVNDRLPQAIKMFRGKGSETKILDRQLYVMIT